MRLQDSALLLTTLLVLTAYRFRIFVRNSSGPISTVFVILSRKILEFFLKMWHVFLYTLFIIKITLDVVYLA